VASLWGHDSGDGKEAGRSPCKVLGYQAPLEVFTAHIRKVFGLTLEFRDEAVSERTLFDTDFHILWYFQGISKKLGRIA
jgi:hypothetical protein